MKRTELFDRTMEDVIHLKEIERISFFMELLVTSIAVLRFAKGDAWIEGFLEAAINDDIKLKPQNFKQ